jgi:drug/metabolite transporter (DMT)-like permease
MFVMDTTTRLDGRTLGFIAIALLTWSSAYAAIAYALASFTPGEVAFARLAIGSLCFAVLLVIRRVPLPDRRDWPQLAALGVIGLTVYHLCLNYAETRIASGTASILISLVPAATVAVSALWLHERLPARALLGLGVALVGVVVVVLASGKQVKFQPMAALVLLSVIASAIFFVGQKPLFARNSMLGVTAFCFFAGTLGALPFAGGLGGALRLAPGSHVAVSGRGTHVRRLSGVECRLASCFRFAAVQLHLFLPADRGADRLAVARRASRSADLGRGRDHGGWCGGGQYAATCVAEHVAHRDLQTALTLPRGCAACTSSTSPTRTIRPGRCGPGCCSAN